jgi:hypothetical protein
MKEAGTINKFEKRKQENIDTDKEFKELKRQAARK